MSDLEFPIVAPEKWANLMPLLIGVVAPVGALVAIGLGKPQPQEWPIIALAIAMMPLMAGLLAWSMHHRSVSLSSAGMRIRGLPWARVVPLGDLDIASVRIVNLDEQRKLRPGFKIAGARLPGFRSGWFRLHDARRAYVLLTDWRRTVELPRKDGRVYLFSLQRPESFIDALGNLTR